MVVLQEQEVPQDSQELPELVPVALEQLEVVVQPVVQLELEQLELVPEALALVAEPEQEPPSLPGA